MNQNGPYRVNLNEATMKAIDEGFGDNAAKFAAIVDEYISLNIEKGEFMRVRLFCVGDRERSMGLRAAWQDLLDPSKAG